MEKKKRETKFNVFFKNVFAKISNNPFGKFIYLGIFLTLAFCIYLIVDNATINPQYFSICEDNNTYEYEFTNKYVSLSGYNGNPEDFHFNEKIVVHGGLTVKTYTVNGVYIGKIGIKDLYLPKTINAVWDRHTITFDTINVDKDNKTFDSREDCNCLIETKTNTLLLASKDKSFIPNSIETIHSFAYMGCNYETITLPENVKTLNAFAFANMKYVKNIVLNDNLEEIKNSVFDNDDLITDIVLPKSLKKINSSTFFDSNISKIFYKGTLKEFLVLINSNEVKSIDAVNSYFECYRKNFDHRIVYYYSEEEPIDKGTTWHYVNNVPTIWM